MSKSKSPLPPKARPKPLPPMWYCHLHDERAFGASHTVRFTDEDGCFHERRCARAVKYVPEIRPTARGGK